MGNDSEWIVIDEMNGELAPANVTAEVVKDFSKMYVDLVKTADTSEIDKKEFEKFPAIFRDSLFEQYCESLYDRKCFEQLNEKVNKYLKENSK